jgi:hypothetical protein
VRYAILTHDHPHLHWDLLLEQPGSCRTWRLARPPESSDPIPAEPLPDHRLLYLDYAGPVSGGRGTVTPWDAGRLVWLTALPRLVVALLDGPRGRFRLELTAIDTIWHAQFHPTPNSTPPPFSREPQASAPFPLKPTSPD